jgi:hypothetical protein
MKGYGQPDFVAGAIARRAPVPVFAACATQEIGILIYRFRGYN